jgi:hypothetical protein
VIEPAAEPVPASDDPRQPVSNGGGGVTGEFRNYPTKDITVDGNLIIQGWTGGWIGVIRTTSAATDLRATTRA